MLKKKIASIILYVYSFALIICTSMSDSLQIPFGIF